MAEYINKADIIKLINDSMLDLSDSDDLNVMLTEVKELPTVTINDHSKEIIVTNCNHLADPSKMVSSSWPHENGKDIIYRQDAIEAIDDIETEVADGFGFQYEKWRKHFADLPSAQPEIIACGQGELVQDGLRLVQDCIDRQAAIDVLRTCYDTETISMDNGDEFINYGDAVGRIEQLPSAQPYACENTCEIERKSNDMISRQAVLEICDRRTIRSALQVGREVMKLPSAQPEPFDDGYSDIYVKEEDALKFYYVESEDDYWIGRRLDNFYYATWDRDLQNFVWSKSRHLPWGEHIVAPDTLWKEHTYPSEPKEIPLKDWLKGFYAKYFVPAGQPERKKGKWIDCNWSVRCSECDYSMPWAVRNFCPNCGTRMEVKND